jgi:pimeloyl-ACP methyl ester carboxylesterase
MTERPPTFAESALTQTTFETRTGLKLAADVLGSGERGAVVLAHGGGQTRHSWGATAERLAELGWRAISLDLRGHGDSDWHPEGDYQALSIGEDLIDVAAGLDAPPALIGASLGGIAGLMAEAVIAPGAFESLTLVDIIPRSDSQGAAKILGFMNQNVEQGFASLEEAADAIAAYLPHRPKRTDLSGLSKNLRLHADGRYRWHWDPRFTTGVRGEQAGSADRRSVDFEAACRAIRIPVHVIRGRMSELVSLEAAQAFVAALKNGSLTDVTGAGHMVAGDRNDVFMDAVVAFLGRQEETARGL